MAQAKKCDICGKLYEIESKKERPINGIAMIYVDSHEEWVAKEACDICPECIKEITDFIDERRKN